MFYYVPINKVDYVVIDKATRNKVLGLGLWINVSVRVRVRLMGKGKVQCTLTFVAIPRAVRIIAR